MRATSPWLYLIRNGFKFKKLFSAKTQKVEQGGREQKDVAISANFSSFMTIYLGNWVCKLPKYLPWNSNENNFLL